MCSYITTLKGRGARCWWINMGLVISTSQSEGRMMKWSTVFTNIHYTFSQVLWAVLGGACVLIMVGMLAVSARVVKRVLRAFRPASVSTPLETLRRRTAWFPLQRRTWVPRMYFLWLNLYTVVYCVFITRLHSRK